MDDVLDRLNAALAGRYLVVREIGAGGMAAVYLADDLKHHRKVALKILRPELAAALGPQRFLREIAIAAQLSHPHILPVHDSGDADGFLYYVMPLVEGESLGDRLAREGALPIGEAVRLLRDVADALACAHAHGVVHRDIKPDNIMIAGRHALVMDFGVARAVSDAGATAQLTSAGMSIGTPAYMAPEQAAGDPVDQRADLYAFGVVAYETVAGRLPFAAATAQAMMAAHLTERPDPIGAVRAETPPALAAAIMRCLEKDSSRRFQTADALLSELEALATPSTGTASIQVPRATWRGRRAAAAATLVVLGLLSVAGFTWRRSTRAHYAREVLVPRIRLLADSALIEQAWVVARQALAVIPRDSALSVQLRRVSRVVNIRSDPPGARVYRRAWAGADTSWELLGTTPLDSIRVPATSVYGGQQGAWYLRFEAPGRPPLEILTARPGDSVTLGAGAGPDRGMVVVRGGRLDELNLPGLEQFGGITLRSFLMDAHEVTNRQFKVFVDSGGYRRPEFWTEPMIEGGRAAPLAAAMARFTDRTGRPGPATWEAGDYPTGQAEFPVAGVSWYEAAAYARFVGKSLPTVFHWARAAGTTYASWIVPHSNFDSRAPVPVGSLRDQGPFGVYDMGGNVREWCANSTGAGHYILGGGWNDPGYAFIDAYSQPSLDRSPTNGIRLVRYAPDDTALASAARTLPVVFRDYLHERPANAALFQAYRRFYDYDPGLLDAVAGPVDSSAEDFAVQRIVFNAPYGHERMAAWLYLPRRARPPYQTVVYWPGSNALNQRTFEPLGLGGYLSFFLKSGRAVLFPILKSTYERGDGYENDVADESGAYRDHAVMQIKDFRRALDYLATRPDLDTSRIAYFGISWGGVMGGMVPAVEPRIRVVMLMVAGLPFQRSTPEVDPFQFLPRVTQPVLMMNGRYDHYFPVETSQIPFFRNLGTPADRKRQVIAEGGHYVPRAQLITETLSWLDRYLGPVN